MGKCSTLGAYSCVTVLSLIFLYALLCSDHTRLPGALFTESFLPPLHIEYIGFTACLLIVHHISQVDEDCLYLNLWVPKTGRTDYPTMIFMHGGNFRDGSGSALLYDGRILAQDADAIIITINYRTGTETKARSEVGG